MKHMLLVLNKSFLIFNCVLFVLNLMIGNIPMAAFSVFCGALNYFAVKQLS